jgi:hypothetical protein
MFLQSSLGSKKIPVQIPVPDKIYTHKLQMALAPGDTLVLATNHTDENDNLRPDMYPIGLFYVDRIDHKENSIDWCIRDSNGIVSENAFRHELADIYLAQPVKIIKNHKGLCTLFTVKVRHGYRMHYLDFAKNRFPEIYKQLHLS